jgi:parallel beta-helix repeat protein
MTNLTLTALQNHESPVGVYNIVEDYTILGGTFTMPADKTLKFNGGTINNGTLHLNNNLLQDMVDGSINSKITGTIQNSVIRTKQISGIDNLRLSDYSGKTINCDKNNDALNHVIILDNTDTTLTTTFDGKNNTITCNSGFFRIEGQSNIIIKNFIANANPNMSDIEFEEMRTSAANVTGIQVYSNIVNGFRVGISLNNDSQDYTVSYCAVHHNVINYCPGSTSGKGYGIHLANARHCTITNNTINNCERHAIYHAYGEDNTISYNTIKNHCHNLTTYNLLAALEIGRKSKNVTVSHNTFENNNNVCLLVYSPFANADADGGSHPWRYGKCESINIHNNTFDRGNLTGNIGNLPFIYIGWEGAPYISLSSAGKVVVDVHISNNTFKKNGGENHKCIQINQCEQLTMQGNSFELGLPSSPQSSEYLVFHIPQNFISGNSCQMIINQNLFNYLTTGIGNLYLMGKDLSLINTSNSPNYHVIWYNNTLQNQIIGGNTMYKIYNPSYPPGNNCSIV